MAKVAYIASQLPKRSETFVYRELSALRAAGVEVLAVSLHPPETGLGERLLDELALHALPVYGTGTAALARDALRELAGHPLKAIGTLGQALRDAVRERDLAWGARLKLLPQALASLALARRLREHRVRHLHAHFAHAPATLALYAARQLGVPFSFTGHAVDLFRDRALLHAKLRRARFVNCISEWHRSFYRTLVARPDQDYPIVRCGVDPTDFAPVAHAPNEPPRVLGVGRLVPKKGFDVLLRAAARLKQEGVRLQVRIAGDGPELAALEALRHELGLDPDVEFPGACANRQVRTWLQTADLFVLPCRVDAEGDRDGIPVVLMEAMACGVCVVSGDLPAIRELVADGITGRLTAPGDVQALAEVLRTLLADPDLRARLARGGQQRVATEFSLEVNVNRMLSCLHHE